MENSDAYDVIIVLIISPLDHARRSARQQIGPRFRLVWCRAPIKVVAGRDVKGLYAMARQGKIQDLVGFSETGVAFEEPSDADLTWILETRLKRNQQRHCTNTSVRSLRVSPSDPLGSINRKTHEMRVRLRPVFLPILLWLIKAVSGGTAANNRLVNYGAKNYFFYLL